MSLTSRTPASWTGVTVLSRFFPVAIIAIFFVQGHFSVNASDLTDYGWDIINPAANWTPRAGLQVVELDDEFYLMGGRTPLDPSAVPVFGASDIWADVWKSSDRGAHWVRIVDPESANHWPARAYFQAVTKGDAMYVLGGQNFNVVNNPSPFGPPQISVSDFFNDVWSSTDGISWELKTTDAGWQGRAGLSSVVYRDDIYVFGGSRNDDSAVIGPGGPPRIYFNDVWKSSNDGVDWELVTEEAPWTARAGAAAVVKDDFIYLLGGEDGFTCDSGPRCPPYFNDVWRTQDGISWESVTDAADWVARPGHQALVIDNKIVVFGGFGLSTDPNDPFRPSNPMDMWVSDDGAAWELLDQVPWNAEAPGEIKYDFDALVASNTSGGADNIYTFGGDRETFDPFDPLNHLNVDNDVWSFAPVPEPSTLAMCPIALLAFYARARRLRNRHLGPPTRPMLLPYD